MAFFKKRFECHFKVWSFGRTERKERMKKSVSITDFMDAFTKMRPSNFTYEGLECLYNYLIDFEQDTNTEIELDVIALCCDYSEYKDLEEYKQNYSSINSIKDIKDATTFIPIFKTSRFITQNH